MGKEKQSFKVKNMGDTPPYSPGGNASSTLRNLSKQNLGGIIFGCTHSTVKECVEKQLFGLPGSHMSYVKNIQPGMPLFLFNYSDRKLHGIFEAASDGELGISQHAWSGDGKRKTPYPAQVRVCIRKKCQALSEDQYKKILVDNYYQKSHHFWFELDHAQTGALLTLFESLPLSTTTLIYKPIQRSLHEALNNTDGNDIQITTASSQQQLCLETIFASDCTNLHHSDTGIGSDKKIGENEEELINLKLKQIALDEESLSTSLKDHIEEAFFSSTKVMAEDQYLPAAPSISEKGEYGFINSSIFQSAINQGLKLKSEVENLKALSLDSFRKSSVLENKLACSVDELQRLRDHVKLLESQLHKSDVEIQQLRDRVKLLESQLNNSSTACIGEQSVSYGLGRKELIFIMGGCNGSRSLLSTADCYSTSNDTVRCLKSMTSTRSYSSAAVLNGCIFNFGGSVDLQGDTWYDTVDRYNPWNHEWTPAPPLNEKKGFMACATLHNRIFAFGGWNGVDCSSDVEMFDPDLEQWLRMHSMIQMRFCAAAAELNGSLYVVGGYDGRYLNSAERLDPRERSWSMIASMKAPRGNHSTAILNEKLYVLGGLEGNNMLASVEVYDPRMGLWVVDDEMEQPRGHFFAPVIGEKIYIIGGLKSTGVFTDTVECYQEGHGWSVTSLKGIGNRCHFSAVVLEGGDRYSL